MSLQGELQACLDRLRAERGFPGATAAVIAADGERSEAATGLADLETGEPMKPRHRMPAASIGKTWVAATALLLQRRGLIDLDQPLAELLGSEPWWRRLPHAGDVTLRHLLSHSAGLDDHVFDEGWREEARARRDLDDERSWFRPHELIEVILDREPLYPLGEGYHYTDTGYIVAGLALETACDDVFETVERELLRPLALDDTEAQRSRTYARLASGYLSLDPPRKVAEAGSLKIDPRTEWTGGGFVSTSHDLATWGRALYGGDLLTEDELDEMLGSGFRSAEAEATYGLGVFLERSEHGELWGHGGWFPGWRSTLYRHRGSGAVVAAQINVSEPDHRGAVRDALFDLVLSR